MTSDWKPGVLHEFERNVSERVRFSLSEFGDRRLIDIRTYYQDDEGSWKPTKRGISIRAELIDELVVGIEKLKVVLNGS